MFSKSALQLTQASIGLLMIDAHHPIAGWALIVLVTINAWTDKS